jgi:hypothetical protein
MQNSRENNTNPYLCDGCGGPRPSRSLPAGVSPTGFGIMVIHYLLSHVKCSDAFGETPKAADEDVRAPQSICMNTDISWRSV